MDYSQNIYEEDESIVNTGGNYSAMSSESLVADDSMKWKEVVGSRFKPTDEVLAGFYLAGKVSGRTDGSIFKLIKEENIYKYKPSDLSSLAYALDDEMMYFFTPIYKKYEKGANIDRKAPGGCWKITGKSSDVNGKDGKPIAKKTSLAYFENDPNSGKPIFKTQWLMREYMLLENDSRSKENPKMSAASLTLCVVYLYENKRKRSQSEMPDNSGKRYRPSSDLHEKKFDEFSMYLNEKGDKASCSNIPPTFYSSSNPAVTPVQGLPSPNCYNNIQNMLMGSESATDPNALIPNHHQSPFSEFDPETMRDLENWLQTQDSDEYLNQLFNDSLNDPQLQLDIVETPSSTVVPLSNTFSIPDLLNENLNVIQNLDPSTNPAEPLRFTAHEAFENANYI